MISKFRAYLEGIKERYEADELFHANEVEANGLANMILLGAVSFILGLLGEQLAQIRKTLAKQNNGR